MIVNISQKVIGIIAARMSSKRFPGKMEKELCGIPLIQYVISEAQKIDKELSIVVATSDRPEDDRIVELAAEKGVSTFRGSLDDVAFRLLTCAEKYGAHYFVRLNGDCPCIDHRLIQQGLSFCDGKYDLISNIPERTFPYGISLEIVNVNTINKCYHLMDSSDKEHVTSYFYRNIGKIMVKKFVNEKTLSRPLRLTVDLPEDLIRLNRNLIRYSSGMWEDMI